LPFRATLRKRQRRGVDFPAAQTIMNRQTLPAFE
jgi:hypothetical protein